MKRSHPYGSATVALASITSLAICGLAPSASGAISLVGVYDENTSNTDTVDVVSTSSDLTLQGTKDRSLAAFNGNTGGVWNFDTVVTNEWNATARSSFNLAYGTSTMTINLRNAADSADLTWATDNQSPISGLLHVGQLSTTPYLLKFSTPLTMFALTQLDRGDAGRTSSITATYEDLTTRSTNTAGSNTDTLHVLTGTASNRITTITLNNNNFIRWDDLAFDTIDTIDTIPEPSAALLGGLGMLMLLRRRRCYKPTELACAMFTMENEIVLIRRPMWWTKDGVQIPESCYHMTLEQVCADHGWNIVAQYGDHFAIVAPSAP